MDLFRKGRKGPSDISIVVDEFVVEVVESKEGLDAFHVRGLLLVGYCFDLLRVDLDTVRSDDKPKEPGRYHIKFALLDIYLEAYLS